MTSTADRLMKLASEADTLADQRMAEADTHAATLDYHLAGKRGDAFREEVRRLQDRAHFHRGQASGFRQSAYYAAVLEGTNAND